MKTRAMGRWGLPLVLCLFLAVVAPTAANADSLVYVKGDEVWISHTDGSNARPVTSSPNNWAWPSEADDGTIVAAGGHARTNPGGTDADDSSELYHLDQLGHQIGAAVETPGSESMPGCPTFRPFSVRVSPDGRRVAYNDVSCDNIDSFSEDLGSGHFDLISDSYETSVWADNAKVVISHDGPTLSDTLTAYGLWEVDGGNGAGPTDGPTRQEYEAVVSRDGHKVAILEWDSNVGGGLAAADILLFAASAPIDTTAPTLKCTIGLDVSKFSDSTAAGPSFTPDGSRLAWGEDDGIHVLNTSNLDSCGSIHDSLLVPGAAYPFFGKAAESDLPPQTPPQPPAPACCANPTTHTFALVGSTKAAKLTPKGALTFFITAAESGSGSATGTINVPRAAKVVRFKKAKLKLVAGKRTKITLRLSKKDARLVRRALKHRKKLTARITVTAHAASGDSARQRLRIKLKR